MHKNILLLLLPTLFLISCIEKPEPQSTDWNQIKKEIEQELTDNILNSWYPTIIDTLSGGYLSNLDASFMVMDQQEKMIVTQARHMWTTAMVAKRNSDEEYLKYSAHGLPFLQKMWDRKHGGFYQNVDRDGNPLDSVKTAYGNAFAIYGLSAYFEASEDSAALILAQQTFDWLEEHSHDPEHGGYFQVLRANGDVIPYGEPSPTFSPSGLKDQNSSIHLLEAFTSLYNIWPDPLLRERLEEMYRLVKDVMFNDRHYLDLYFYADLKPVSNFGKSRSEILEHAELDHVSFGHDIETAFLLLEASETLSIQHDQTLLEELKSIVDHAILGIDPDNGGLYDQGYYFDLNKPLEIIRNTKAWWAQAEALNTLLIFHQFFPEEGYDRQFVNMWNYIKKYLIDHEHGGWYSNGLDTNPGSKNGTKANIWKSTYHNYRALANILQLLESAPH